MAGPSGTNSTMVITLGIFLKLLGFFAVLVSYSDLEPIKSRQAEYSLQNRFGINMSLTRERDGLGPQSAIVVQQLGRSYDTISQNLMTQVDFLSSENVSVSDRLRISLPADVVLSLDDAPAKSADFATSFSNVLKTQKPPNYIYQVNIMGQNGIPPSMMRALGEFVQKMIAAGYPAKYLTISYEQTPDDKPAVLMEIQAVPS